MFDSLGWVHVILAMRQSVPSEKDAHKSGTQREKLPRNRKHTSPCTKRLSDKSKASWSVKGNGESVRACAGGSLDRVHVSDVVPNFAVAVAVRALDEELVEELRGQRA